MSSLGQAQVGIGTTSPDASSILDLSSTNKGLLLPRLTTSQRDYLFIEGNDNSLTISIYSVLGEKVISAENTDKIDVKGLSNGTYIIRIKEGLKEVMKKFIKI